MRGGLEAYRLPVLHKGFWVFQSPRVLSLAVYAREKGLDPAALVSRHLGYVSSRLLGGDVALAREKAWLVERLRGYGYTPGGFDGRGAARVASSVARAVAHLDYYVEKLALHSVVEEWVEFIDELLESLGSRGPESAALLPPTLLTPEKLLLLRALSSSERFALPTYLELVYRSMVTGVRLRDLTGLDRDTANRELRFRYCYAYTLNLTAGNRFEQRLAGLGLAVLEAFREGVDPVRGYVAYGSRSGRLHRLIALDIVALDAYQHERFEALLSLEEAWLRRLGVKEADEVVGLARRLFALQPSDAGGVMVAPAEPIDSVIEVVEA